MIRLADQEITALKKIVYDTPSPQERENTSHREALHGKALVSVMRQRGKKELWTRAFIMVSTERNR